MPRISTPSKIAGTRLYTPNVIFSGSTSQEREAVVREVMADKGAVLVPPYDHPDIILGQGTVGLEMEKQVVEQKAREREKAKAKAKGGVNANEDVDMDIDWSGGFDAVITPIGGGGLLGGTATWFSDKPGTLVFGGEPSFQGADDARRGLLQGRRIEHVKTLTIADGLRTPVGLANWAIISDRAKLEGIYAVSEDQIKMAMRLVLERMKLVVEPSGCVPLAVVLFNREFRDMVAQRQMGLEKGCWDLGVVFSGGNTTVKAISALFAEETTETKGGGVQGEEAAQRQAGKVGADGETVAEDVAG